MSGHQPRPPGDPGLHRLPRILFPPSYYTPPQPPASKPRLPSPPPADTSTIPQFPATSAPSMPRMPPLPPLLKIPPGPVPGSSAALPPVSSGPSLLSHHQTPYQAQYCTSLGPEAAPGPSTLRSHLASTIPPPGPAPAPCIQRSYLPQLASTSPPPGPGTAPAPGPLNLVVRTRSVSEDSDSSSVRSGDSREQSNAAKCREYREKNKVRRQQEEAEYHEELRKNEELKKVYDQKEQSIAKLKEYYYECLKKGTFVGQSKSKKKKPKKMKNSHVDRFKITETSTNCDDNKASSKKAVKSESDFQPNVWIKPELFDTDS